MKPLARRRLRVYNKSTMLKTLSAFMAWVVFISSVCAAKMSALDAADVAQAPASQTLAIKERALKVPAGSVVEVRLTNKEELKGRIGDISDDGIVLKYTKAGQIEERKIAFSEVRSLKKQRSRGWRVTRNVLLVLGVLTALVVIASAATGDWGPPS
jgi:hypothetical protein